MATQANPASVSAFASAASSYIASLVSDSSFISQAAQLATVDPALIASLQQLATQSINPAQLTAPPAFVSALPSPLSSLFNSVYNYEVSLASQYGLLSNGAVTATATNTGLSVQSSTSIRSSTTPSSSTATTETSTQTPSRTQSTQQSTVSSTPSPTPSSTASPTPSATFQTTSPTTSQTQDTTLSSIENPAFTTFQASALSLTGGSSSTDNGLPSTTKIGLGLGIGLGGALVLALLVIWALFRRQQRSIRKRQYGYHQGVVVDGEPGVAMSTAKYNQ